MAWWQTAAAIFSPDVDPAEAIAAQLLAPLPVAPPLTTPTQQRLSAAVIAPPPAASLPPSLPATAPPVEVPFPAWQLRDFDALAQLLGVPGDRGACAVLLSQRDPSQLTLLLRRLYARGS
jgi:hypothetical protein